MISRSIQRDFNIHDNRHINSLFLNQMKSQNTCIPEDVIRWNFKNQVKAILASEFLRGRVFIDFANSQESFNSQSQLSLQIKIIRETPTLNEDSPGFLNLKILLPSQYSPQQPTFILTNSSQSTYREMQLIPNHSLEPSFKLVEVIQDIAKSIEEGIIDIGFFYTPKTKVNLHSGLYEQNQGLNISRNSCFKFSSRIQNESDANRQQKSNSEGLIGCGSTQNYRNSQKKRSNQPMKKNANLPKFLIRIFIKYVQKFRKLYPKREFDRLNNECKKMKQWKRSENKQQALGLKHLKMLFQQFKDGFPDPRLNRKIVINVISKYLLQEICQNSQIPQTHRLGYLVACRVYALRCRNSTLAGRIQSK